MDDVIGFYNAYTENERLTKRRSRILEKITTLKYINEYVGEKAKIADIGAGTGIYTFELAERAEYILAVDLVQKHVDEISKIANEKGINTIKSICASATNLSAIESSKFDIVLCLGPLYHIKSSEERLKCFEECKRIAKKEGIIFVAYINKLLALNYFVRNRKFFTGAILSEIENGKIEKAIGFDDFLDIGYFSDPEEIEKEAHKCHLRIIKNIGADGISYFFQDQLEEMNEDQWESYLKMHLEHCEDKQSFGMSMHGLMICKK